MNHPWTRRTKTIHTPKLGCRYACGGRRAWETGRWGSWKEKNGGDNMKRDRPSGKPAQGWLQRPKWGWTGLQLWASCVLSSATEITSIKSNAHKRANQVQPFPLVGDVRAVDFKSWESTSLTPTIAAKIWQLPVRRTIHKLNFCARSPVRCSCRTQLQGPAITDHVQSVLAIPYRVRAFFNLSTSKLSIIRWQSGLNKIAACKPDIAQKVKENASRVGRRSWFWWSLYKWIQVLQPV